MQNDFCKNGSLEVKGAEEIIPYINNLIFSKKYSEIVLTQDYHPKEHKSFAESHGKAVGEIVCLNGVSQILWPRHCVQGTYGSEFHKDVNPKLATQIIKKGMNLEQDNYSAFSEDLSATSENLCYYLKNKKVEALDVVGLALEYCVKNTCIDAVIHGFDTALHYKGTKAVNFAPNDIKDTIFELVERGVSIIN